MKPLFLILMIAVFAFSGFGQAKFSAKVKLMVQHKDSAIESDMQSYLARELRSLGDVTVVDSGENYRIRVLVMTAKNGSGTSMGYVMSTIVTQIFHCSPATTDKKPVILTYDDFRDESLRITSLDGLRGQAEAIITDFDKVVLEPDRKLFRLFNK